MSKLTRQANNRRRKERERAHLARIVPSYGCGIKGMRHYVLRRTSGRDHALYICRSLGRLRLLLDPGWSVDSISGMGFDLLRSRGLPVFDGESLTPMVDMPPPNTDWLKYAHATQER